MARIVLQSPLSPAAIATKLKEVLGDRTARPVKGVTGNGTEQDMTLFYFRPNIQNSFQTSLTATMEPAGGGTRIEGKIGTPASARVFMGCWFGFLTVFLALAGGGTIASGAPLGAIVPFVAIPLVMMAFGALLWRLGTWTAKQDEAAILAFLATTLAARPLSGA
ncbi:MAG: hypothetical protein WC729_12690 [Sphingomonas sp.]|jgi:hypothetical protein|uniref:hypothetical protein n=1 Tax=Sphingomonas sp. TaxID=28214 RepID=UPI00356622B9